MPQTQAQLLLQLRDRIDESTQRFWTDRELTDWLNEGIRVIARRTETLEDTEYQLQAQPQIGRYALPRNCLTVHRCEFAPQLNSQLVYPMELKTYYEMDELWGTQQLISRSYPSYAVFWGAPPNITMQVFPVPSQAGVFQLYYYRLPRTLGTTAPTDNPENIADVFEGWHDLAVTYAEYMALRKDRDDRWQDAKQLFEEGLSELVDHSRRHHDQAQGMVMKGYTTMSDMWEIV
jgi:hypothetical protein